MRLVTTYSTWPLYSTLDQPESVLLERVQQIGAVRRDLSLYALPGAEVCVLQRRSVIAQMHYR